VEFSVSFSLGAQVETNLNRWAVNLGPLEVRWEENKDMLGRKDLPQANQIWNFG